MAHTSVRLCSCPKISVIDLIICPQISDVQEDYEIVSKEDCRPDELAGDRLQMYSRLERDLLEQYKLCKENREA